MRSNMAKPAFSDGVKGLFFDFLASVGKEGKKERRKRERYSVGFPCIMLRAFGVLFSASPRSSSRSTQPRRKRCF